MAAIGGEVNFTTEPVELPGVSPADPPTVQVPGRVWHGGCPVDFEWVQLTGIDLVVDLADADSVAPATDVEGLTYLKCPLVDGSELPSPTLTLGLAGLVADLVRDGHRALIHCTFGRNRSGLLATLVVRDLLGLSGADALAHVQAHREGAVNNEDFAGWLRSLPAPAAAAASA
ncbi:MAG TPA: dual specificity protein phosphatase family protein [Intrasporangium sp.]|nr:dual specificity protein phosphatase family protein [Intrasporangium sp.]